MEGFGPFEARHLAFLETVSTLRPRLHRYCARMTGSGMDGEDVVQEHLTEAYRKLDKYNESRPLKPSLFRIAHNRCTLISCDAGEWRWGRGRRSMPEQSRQLSWPQLGSAKLLNTSSHPYHRKSVPAFY